jgi:hypothetical protein
MSATYTAVILLSLLSCLTTSIGVVLALPLRPRTIVRMGAATPHGMKSAAEERPRMVRRESGVGHPAE